MKTHYRQPSIRGIYYLRTLNESKGVCQERKRIDCGIRIEEWRVLNCDILLVLGDESGSEEPNFDVTLEKLWILSFAYVLKPCLQLNATNNNWRITKNCLN